MRNKKVLEDFYAKIQAEIEAAAQAIFERNQAKFESLVYNQLSKGDKLYQANGAAVIENKDGVNVGDAFTDVLAQFQYPLEIASGFDITYKTVKQ